MFIISNGDFYIAQFSTGLKPVRTKDEAIQFKTYDKASSFMLNMPKSFKNLGYHIEGKAETTQSTTQMTQPIPSSPFKVSEHKKVVVKYDSDYLNEIKDEISHIEFFINDLKKKKQEAIEALEKSERDCFDWEHCSEFYNKDNCTAGKYWRRFGEARRERRRAKDTIVIVDAIFEDNNFDGILSQKTMNRISGLENRTYSVRELDDIFPDN